MSESEPIVIEAGRSERHYWRDLWRYRELFYFLAWRDILVRYKQTAIGILWALIRPVLTTVVLVIVFGKLAKLPSNGIPYPVLVLSALLPWQFVSTAFSESGNSLLGNANMISKVYFPRLVIPASAIIVCLVDFLIAALILVAVMFWYGYTPGPEIMALPLFVFLAFVTALGAGLWVAALNVKYRDFRFIIPFSVQFGLYISPVGFSSAIVPEQWRFWYSLNPMVGVIDGFRWALLGEDALFYWPGFALSLVIVTTMGVSGFVYFRRTEKTLADVI
jgi:lipopolysaccharide transport system permease protein